MGVGAAAVVLVWLVALSAYDIGQRRLPNWLTLPGAATVAGAAVLSGHGAGALAGAAALTVLYLLVHLVSPSSMGGGGVKQAQGVTNAQRRRGDKVR